MSRPLALRALVLGAIALLAILLGLALTPLGRGSSEDEAPGPVGEWHDAVVGTYRLDPATRQTACGYAASDRTLGIAHPVLPCGAKIVIEYGGKQVLTQVIDRGTGVPGRAFDVTAKLASELGLRGVQPIRWAYAG